ncbi:MAG: hypothetical protein HYX73_08700, partial [Acidobacteria bacterium]|nr:hypothetical protein [Acidobacteriota bacterium]
VFTLFAALLVVGLYRILPKYVFEGQRFKEEELIFRGEEYQRGIQLFVRKFGRYPTSLEELEDTSQIRFIRKLYPDPMTEEGEWRLVHIGPNAVFIDSVHLTGAASSSGSSSTQGTSSGQSESDPFDLTPRDSEQREDEGDPATRASSNPNPTQQPRASSGVQAGQSFGGGGIAGVASKNEAEAIKVVGGFTHYNEWEFLYDYRTDPLGLAAVNRVTGGGQQQQRQQPNQPGGQAPGPGQPPVGRNPLTGQPIGIPTPGIGGPTSIPGSPVPIPGGPPTWRGGPPPTRDPLGRP